MRILATIHFLNTSSINLGNGRAIRYSCASMRASAQAATTITIAFCNNPISLLIS